MKASVICALFAGAALAQPQRNPPNQQKKMWRPRAVGHERDKVCGVHPDAPLSERAKAAEACDGSAAYCFHKKYLDFGERFDSGESCIISRGFHPDWLVSRPVDRHFWDLDARNKAFQMLGAANDLHARYVWMRFLQENVDSPAMAYREEENRLIREFLLYTESTKNQATRAVEEVKKKVDQAYRGDFVDEIKQRVDVAVGNFETEWNHFNPTILPVWFPRLGETKNNLLLAAELYARYRIIAKLEIKSLAHVLPTLYEECGRAMDRALSLPDGRQFRSSIDEGRKEQEKNWEMQMGTGIRNTVNWITDREMHW